MAKKSDYLHTSLDEEQGIADYSYIKTYSNITYERMTNIPPTAPLAAPATKDVIGIWSVLDQPNTRLIVRRNGS